MANSSSKAALSFQYWRLTNDRAGTHWFVASLDASPTVMAGAATRTKEAA
jgi:hypothetical protein